MPIRYNSRDVLQAMLILPQTTFAEVTDGALFRKFEADAIAPVIPTTQRVPDNRVGSGNGNPKASRTLFLNQKQLTLPSPLRARLADKMLRLLCGGAVDSTEEAGTPSMWAHVIDLLTTGSEPLQTNLLRLLGGEEFIHAGAYVLQMVYSQGQGQEPTVQFGLGNSGHYQKISDTAMDTADIEEISDYPRADYAYHPSKTVFTFTAGSGFNFGYGGSSGRLISLNITLSVPIIVKYAPGKDTPINATDHTLGFYSKVFYTDTPSAQVQAVLAMDSGFAEFEKAIKNDPITDLIVKFQTAEEVQATLNRTQVHGVKIPQAEAQIEGQLDGNDSAVGITFTAVEGDATTGSLFQGLIETLQEDLDLDT